MLFIVNSKNKMLVFVIVNIISVVDIIVKVSKSISFSQTSSPAMALQSKSVALSP